MAYSGAGPETIVCCLNDLTVGQQLNAPLMLRNTLSFVTDFFILWDTNYNTDFVMIVFTAPGPGLESAVRILYDPLSVTLTLCTWVLM